MNDIESNKTLAADILAAFCVFFTDAIVVSDLAVSGGIVFTVKSQYGRHILNASRELTKATSYRAKPSKNFDGTHTVVITKK